jgi:hypothetical protein
MEVTSMRVMSAARFERFFRVAAGLDVDKQDLKRYGDFVNREIYGLLIRGEAAAKANGRDLIDPFDLPITKGLQESVHAFRKLDQEVELEPILESLAALPPLDLACSVETDARLSEIAGATELGPRPHLQDHRSRSQEPAVRALGALIPHLRPAAVKRTINAVWHPSVSLGERPGGAAAVSTIC